MLNGLYRALKNKVYRWVTYEPATDEVMPYDFNRLKHEIKPGDVLLIEGRSRVSKVIRSITQSPWTHAALYVGRMVDFEEDDEGPSTLRQHIDAKPSTRLIIEDLLDRGTVVMPLSTYKNHHIRICRPIGITPSDLQTVITFAMQAVGQPYNVRHLLDIGRFVLPWSILPRRWGSSLFRTASGKPESGICSSLIAAAFSTVQFPILPYIRNDEQEGYEVYQRNPHLFVPKDFDYSPYFDIIKYPLFNPDEPLPYYRRLPWNRSGMMHQDDGIVRDNTPPPKRFRIFKRRSTDKKTSPDTNK